MPDYGLHIPFETVLGLIPGTLENKKRRLEAARTTEAEKLVPLESLWLQEGFQAMHPNLLRQEEVLGGLGLQRRGLDLQERQQGFVERAKERELELDKDRLALERMYREGVLEQGTRELGLRQLQQQFEEQRWRDQLKQMQEEFELKRRLGLETTPELEVRKMLGLLDALSNYKLMDPKLPWGQPLVNKILEMLGVKVDSGQPGMKKVSKIPPEKLDLLKDIIDRETARIRGDVGRQVIPRENPVR